MCKESGNMLSISKQLNQKNNQSFFSKISDMMTKKKKIEEEDI